MIVIVAGVAGSGKLTIGSLLARELGWDFEDGDDLHSAASIAKMEAGHPLTDEDRRPWLGAVATWIDERAAAGRSGVIACSALKRSYRDQLLDGRPELRMVFLEVVDRETLVARLKGLARPLLPLRTARQPAGCGRTAPSRRTSHRGR